METDAPRKPLEVRGYLPGLDVLRGLAVAGVVVFHGFTNAGYRTGQAGLDVVFIRLAAAGQFGVSLFFVLSGFLITTILLKQQDRPDYYRNFYIRRALRILPVYLLLLVVLKSFGLVHWHFVLACLLFIANMARLVHSHPYEYGVLWTLAVEEQFYLLWPTVVRLCRDLRLLRNLTIAGCILAPVCRIALDLRGISTYLLLPTNMDALLYGALCAILIRTGALHGGNIRRVTVGLFAVGSVLLPPCLYLFCFSPLVRQANWVALVWDAFGRLDPFCLFLAGVLFSVRRAQAQFPGRLSLPARVCIFLGYISYGLYLVHPLLFTVYDRLAAGTALDGFHTGFALLLVRFVIVSAASVGLAALSRRYFEQLFLLRKRVLAPYRGESRAATETLA